MIGASQGGLTARFGDRDGGGVYTGFFRTRDLGTAHLLLGTGDSPVVSVVHYDRLRAVATQGYHSDSLSHLQNEHGRLVRTILRLAGDVCLTVGVVVALLACYLLWGTGWRAAQAQRQFAQQLTHAWRAPLTVPTETLRVVTGQPFAFIRIPALGAHWRFTVIQGTALAQLNVSPGHVPGTQLPGQRGNFAIAGHRVTGGNPFWSLPGLRAGDRVYIDTRSYTYTYRVTGKPAWVAPTDLAVLDPVPGHPGARPSRRLITLITCDPAWTGTHRVILTGILTAVHPRVPLPAGGQ
jgi:sortase A